MISIIVPDELSAHRDRLFFPDIDRWAGGFERITPSSSIILTAWAASAAGWSD
jgi:hypothetical protein